VPEQFEHPPIRYPSFHLLHQDVLIDGVEEAPDVRVHHMVVAASAGNADGLECLHGASPGPESVTAILEVRLEDRLQDNLGRHLHHAIPHRRYAQRPLLYHNLGKGRFELVPAVEGTGLAIVTVGRGAAFGDLFNDGKIDAVINSMDGSPVLLRNVYPDHHHWVEMKLIGGPKSPRDAVGATVYLSANGIRQRGDVLSGGSYLSSNDMRVHFGLSDADKVDQLEIHWPSGSVEKILLPFVDRIYDITEDHGVTGSLCKGKPCITVH